MPNPVFDQGPYDAAAFVDDDQSTWPMFQAPASYYQPGMWWTVTGAGTVAGQAAAVGDFLFVIYDAREYGELTYGGDNYGSEAMSNWTIDNVSFMVWDSAVPPWWQPPFPYSGCVFNEEQFPGWRIVMDSLYVDLVGTRTYGTELFGDEVYGDAENRSARWADITRPNYLATVTVGNDTAGSIVEVTEIAVELHDDLGVWFDFAEPQRYYQPFIGAPLRIGFLAPDLEYHPIAVGTIETIRDDHDTLPRYVSVQAFGNLSDLVNSVPSWQRPEELASARTAALIAAGGWRHSTELDLLYPFDATLIADAQPTVIVVRDELDRIGSSIGWMFDTDKWGMLRLREWPLVPVGQAIVTDCEEFAPDGLLSPLIGIVADTSQLVNVAILTNTAVPPLTANVVDEYSISKYGRMSQALDFPRQGMAFLDVSDANRLAQRVVSRYSNVVTHVEDIAGDTLLDGDWLAMLVDLDTGDGVRVMREGIRELSLDGVVIGFEHRITRGRIESTIHTTTLTPTL